MIIPKNCGVIFILSSATFFLSINPATSAGPPPESETEDAEAGNKPFKITSHTAHNPFPADILDRMRTELMLVMGIEPEASEEADKKHNTGH